MAVTPKASLSMVMPMAGRGSRFARGGETAPKPLLELNGRPFFWWATESLRRAATLEEMVFVVLAEHCAEHGVDRRIKACYPEAKVVALPEVTSGAAETAAIGARALCAKGPVAVNDCDHAFHCPAIAETSARLREGVDGALLCFRSDDPAYSYVRLKGDGSVAGTVEKQSVSPFAIAGCYMFSSASVLDALYEDYRRDCPYAERYASGLYNVLAARGGAIEMREMRRHISFGTPAERDRLDPRLFETDFAWS